MLDRGIPFSPKIRFTDKCTTVDAMNIAVKKF